MKPFLIFLFALISAFLLNAFRISETQKKVSRFDLEEYKRKNIVPCSPNWALLKDWLEESDIPPMPGSGSHVWKISTKSDSAQFYFNQGINMYYGFHIIEAMASFKKAARFDPQCATLYWAQALAYGPNINDYGYIASPEALEATGKALELSGGVSKMEQELINAISVRYTADSADVTRESLNQAYTDMMKKVSAHFNANPDAQTLYADAMMLQHPWDLWFTDGNPKPWTALIRQVLEKVIKEDPDHPGANHYYIHVMEPSPYAYKALPSADRLGSITPSLSHMVHMPSHIYLRTGNYDRGTLVNEKAVNSYKKYLTLYAPVAGNDFIYIIHNLHMQTNHAMLQGRRTYAVESAIATQESTPRDYAGTAAPVGNYMQYLYMTPVLADVRFARWNALLSMSEPDKDWPYAQVLYYFGRGMALAWSGKLADAQNELKKLQEWSLHPDLKIPMSPFSPVSEGARIAEQLLKGSIALNKKNYPEAIVAFRIASVTDENMVYTEPRDWLLNPKHYLGHAYLKAGNWKEARQTFEKDLTYNQENGWALYGLYKALTGEHKIYEAEKALARFNKAFEKSDIEISSSVY